MNQQNLIVTIAACAWLLSGAYGQEHLTPNSASPPQSRAGVEFGTGSVWILVPSNVNFSDARLLESGNFNLLKLDASLLGDMNAFASDNLDESSPDVRDQNFRESRKLNLFRKPWLKHKQGQLFLANGTVCRYVNSMPVCTFISTPALSQPYRQGMFFGNNMNNMVNPNGNTIPNMNPNMNQNMNNQNMNNQNNPNMNNMNNNNGFNNRQVNNQGFNQGGNNNQQFRPMAVLDNESTELNVEATESASSNSSTSNGSASGQSTISTHVNSRQPVNFVQVTRPLSLYGRRPLNLLPFRRPMNTQYQMVPGRRSQD